MSDKPEKLVCTRMVSIFRVDTMETVKEFLYTDTEDFTVKVAIDTTCRLNRRDYPIEYDWTVTW